MATALMAWAGVTGHTHAQERLLGRHVAGIGAAADLVHFGGIGVTQYGFAGLDSVRVRRAWQMTFPVAVAAPIGDRWRVDLTALHAIGGVTFANAAGGATRTATLSGTSDIRLRATGRFLSDAVTLTFGVNAPTGRSTLSDGEFGALRVLAAPALAMGSTPVGTGPSGTAGLVLARPIGAWLIAFGASYEHRGRYQPIAAITAGTPSADFRPGAVVRTSLAAERSVGGHRLSVAMATDLFADDRLRGIADGTAAGARTLATVRLGPVITSDAQLQVAARGWREVIVYGSSLWRAAFARDGITAAGSSGQYVEGGVRAARPITPRHDIVLGASGRWHSGLAIDQGLATSGVRSADATVGFRFRRGLVTVQPYLRGQRGSLFSRQTTGASRSFSGVTNGVVLQSRF